MSGKVSELKPWMQPFPSAEQVFSGDLESHRRHLLPLMTIDASAIDPLLHGPLHLVSAKEAYDGATGEHCSEFHDAYCKSGQIAFRVDTNGKYTFLGDFRFFLVERGAKLGTYISESLVGEFKEHYANCEKSYVEAKLSFQRHGQFDPNWARQRDGWLNLSPSENLHFHGPKGKPAPRFIARACGRSYYENGPGTVQLLYEPMERIAIMQFD